MTPAPSRFLLAFTLVVATGVLGMAIGLATLDPYWIWRDQPPWLARWGGHNRVLDIRNRYAKAMQLVTRRPRLVVMGSSKVYRGIDPSGIAGGGAYNLGISSLRVHEALGFTRHLLRWTPVEHLVLGLDWFMFGSDKASHKGYDVDLPRFRYLFDALPIALLTRTAAVDARTAWSGVHRGDGWWTRDGYKATSPRTARQVRVVLKGFYSQPTRVTEAEYAAFAELVERVRRRGVRLDVFVSPLNEKGLLRIEELGQLDAFRAWRGRVAEILDRAGLPLHDFSEQNPFFHERVRQGSTRHWIDGFHYSAPVGAWILSQLGVPMHVRERR